MNDINRLKLIYDKAARKVAVNCNVWLKGKNESHK